MDIREVKDLIHEVLQSDISEFELEHGGTRVRLKRGFSRESTSASAATSACRFFTSADRRSTTCGAG